MDRHKPDNADRLRKAKSLLEELSNFATENKASGRVAVYLDFRDGKIAHTRRFLDLNR